MKKFLKIIPFVLIFCLLFSSVSFGASAGVSKYPFMNGFPLIEDESLYSSAETPYFNSFFSSPELLVEDAISKFGTNKGFSFNFEDMEYILFYYSSTDLRLLFWDSCARPKIRFDCHDNYNQLVFVPSITSSRSDSFRFGSINMYCGKSSSKINYTHSSSTIDFISAYYRWYPEIYNDYTFQCNNKGWYMQVYPIIQKGADLPFSFDEIDSQLFPSDSVDVPEEDTGEFTYPEIPEDTDSGIVTLIKAIASFFGQLFSKLNSLFSSLINKVGSFFNNLFSGISDLYSDLKDFLSNTLNSIIGGINSLLDNVVNIYNYLTDTNISFGYFFNSNLYSFIEQIMNIKNRLTFSDVSPNDSVSFELDFSKSNSFLSSVGVVSISFDWYLQYRSAFSTLLLVFVYAGLGFRFFKELPSLISGNSGEESVS